MKTLARFLKEESGATAIEYVIIAAGTFFAILTTIQLMGDKLGDLFRFLASSFTTIQS